jgi:hypothetical protein
MIHQPVDILIDNHELLAADVGYLRLVIVAWQGRKLMASIAVIVYYNTIAIIAIIIPC